MIRCSSLFFILLAATQLSCSSLSATHDYKVVSNFPLATDSNKQLVDLYRPERNTPAPVVLVIHGGSWTSKAGDMSSICKQLSKQGFLAINISYRFAPEHRYPAALSDVRESLNYVYENAERLNADKSRIYVWGYSAGGHLALMLAFTTEDRIQGAVAGSAPSDFPRYSNSPIIEKFIGKSYAEAPDIWKQASPINHVSKSSPPIFMYHGRYDSLIDIDLMYSLKRRLEDFNVPVETYESKWLGHIGVYLFSQEAVDRGIKFLLSLAAENPK